ncbi:hypothetical protein [Nonomuraea dietziae]|uniref:hypothetical protein n=1 Tax=Nonomuraea dietziae TaxID=65515 RepID=UPI0031CF98BF
MGGAMIMPATLSIIRQVFTDRRERALALGVWSAVAGGRAPPSARWSAACSSSTSGGARSS